MTSAITAVCERCACTVAVELGVIQCPHCGGALSIPTDPVTAEHLAKLSAPGLWRYAELFPPLGPSITLGEPTTPVVSVPWGDHPGVSFKLEYLLPSGSFKDRGSAFLVSYLSGLGAPRVVEDSSGNAGASLSAYAARAHLPCTIYLPDHTSPGKIAQVVAYGAQVERIVGPRSAATVAVERAVADNPLAVYAAHLWHPVFLLGMQTFGFELIEQLKGHVPDVVIAPAGSGGLVLGVIHALERLRDGGVIAKLPRVYGVQSEACDPIAQRFGASPPGEPPGGTLAEGILVTVPPRLETVVDAIMRTGGSVLRVSDTQLLAASARIGSEGFWIEPTSAVAVAALDLMLADGTISSDHSVVVALTGSGLKTSAAASSDRV